jgi:hypothetical protein
MKSLCTELPVTDVTDVPSNGQPANTNSPMSAGVPPEVPTTNTAQRLEFLYKLSSKFRTETWQNGLLQTIMEHLVDEIPGATRGALLLNDHEKGQKSTNPNDRFLLPAYVSSNGPIINMALASRAMSEGKGFIWPEGKQDEIDDGFHKKGGLLL